MKVTVKLRAAVFVSRVNRNQRKLVGFRHDNQIACYTMSNNTYLVGEKV